MTRYRDGEKRVRTTLGLFAIAFALWLMLSTDAPLIQMTAALLLGVGIFLASYQFAILLVPRKKGIVAGRGRTCFLFLGAASVFALAIAVSAFQQTGNILGYYILVTIGLSILLLMISWIPAGHSSWRISLVVLLICIYSLVLRGVVFFSYPSIVGVDPWTHARIVESIVQSGSAIVSEPLQTVYRSFPAFHVFSASGLILENVDVKTALFLNNGIPIGLLPLWVFLIFRSLFGIRLGLLAALLACCTTDFIRLGWWIIPAGFGLSFFLTLLYAYLPHRSVAGRGNSIVFILVCTVVPWIHLVTPVSAVVICGFVLVTKRILKTGLFVTDSNGHESRSSNRPLNLRPKLLFLIAAVLASLIVQMNMYPVITGFLNAILGENYYAPTPHLDRSGEVLITIWERFPILLMLVLSMVGVLTLLRHCARNDRSGMNVPLAISGIVLGSLSILNVLATDYYYSERLLPYSYLCLMGVAAIPLYAIIRRIESFPSISAIAALAVVTIMVFPLLTSGVSNIDSTLPWVHPNRVSFTENEISAERFIINVDARVYTDPYYFGLFDYSGYGNWTMKIDSSGLLDGNHGDSVTLLRTRSMLTPIKIENAWSLIMDTGQVKGYVTGT